MYYKWDHPQIVKVPFYKGRPFNYTMRTNVLNWCNLVSISKNVVFYASGMVRIY